MLSFSWFCKEQGNKNLHTRKTRYLYTKCILKIFLGKFEDCFNFHSFANLLRFYFRSMIEIKIHCEKRHKAFNKTLQTSKTLQIFMWGQAHPSVLHVDWTHSYGRQCKNVCSLEKILPKIKEIYLCYSIHTTRIFKEIKCLNSGFYELLADARACGTCACNKQDFR